jgi:hypothetical protein
MIIEWMINHPWISGGGIFVVVTLVQIVSSVLRQRAAERYRKEWVEGPNWH